MHCLNSCMVSFDSGDYGIPKSKYYLTDGLYIIVLYGRNCIQRQNDIGGFSISTKTRIFIIRNTSLHLRLALFL